MLNDPITALLKNKLAALGLLGFTLAVLLTSDAILYPHLSPLATVELSGLRWLLLVFPILGLGLVQHTNQLWAKALGWLIWFVFIPYALYSILEIRHVAEICRLSEGTYFTEYCAADTWKIVPLFFYAGLGVLGFYITTASLIRSLQLSWGTLVILALTLYSALTSVFGIYTRFNSWEIAYRPAAVWAEFLAVLMTNSFLLNVLLLWLLFSIVSLPLWLQKR